MTYDDWLTTEDDRQYCECGKVLHDGQEICPRCFKESVDPRV